MKTNFFLFGLLFSLVSIFISSCKCGFLQDCPIDDVCAVPVGGTCCNNKSILEYNSLLDLQNEHKTLFQSFMAQNEDELVLINFETNKNHYSLRKKDNDMDDGIIPDDPTFDPSEYTSDDILEAILNQDGMVVIAGDLYMWDDLCVISKCKFSCTAYNNMLIYRNKVRQYGNIWSPQLKDEIINLKTTNGIEEVPNCGDVRFDFETISEENLSPMEVNGGYMGDTSSRKSGCGLTVNILANIISDDTQNKKIKYKLTAQSIQPGNAPLFIFSIDEKFTGYNQITIVDGDRPNKNGSDWDDLLTIAKKKHYIGDWVEIEVDYSNPLTTNNSSFTVLPIKLFAVTDLFSGNSCYASDEIGLDLGCRILISKTMLNAQQGQWAFTIEGLPTTFSGTIQWDFGDGNSTSTTAPTVIHSYAVACFETTYTVTALLPLQYMCVELYSVEVVIPNPCMYTERRGVAPIHNTKVDGKRVKLVFRIRPTGFLNFNFESKIINKFRWRKTGWKTIETSKNIYMEQGTGPCVAKDIPTHFGCSGANCGNAHNSDKRLKQVLKSSNKIGFDANDPYEVKFSHSNTNFPTQTCQFQINCPN